MPFDSKNWRRKIMRILSFFLGVALIGNANAAFEEIEGMATQMELLKACGKYRGAEQARCDAAAQRRLDRLAEEARQAAVREREGYEGESCGPRARSKHCQQLMQREQAQAQQKKEEDRNNQLILADERWKKFDQQIRTSKQQFIESLARYRVLDVGLGDSRSMVLQKLRAKFPNKGMKPDNYVLVGSTSTCRAEADRATQGQYAADCVGTEVGRENGQVFRRTMEVWLTDKGRAHSIYYTQNDIQTGTDAASCNVDGQQQLDGLVTRHGAPSFRNSWLLAWGPVVPAEEVTRIRAIPGFNFPPTAEPDIMGSRGTQNREGNKKYRFWDAGFAITMECSSSGALTSRANLSLADLEQQDKSTQKFVKPTF